MTVNASDDGTFRILDKCLQRASQFILEAHSRGVGVLVHCMAGVNRCLP
jgi:protein-tyrosine phosphatase